MSNYFEHIRGLNNLQLCYFLEQIQAELQLCSLALSKAENPDIYCSEDNFCIGTPDRGKTDRYLDSIHWHRCLSKECDDILSDKVSSRYAQYTRKTDPSTHMVVIHCTNEHGKYQELATYVRPLDKWITKDGKIVEDKVETWSEQDSVTLK